MNSVKKLISKISFIDKVKESNPKLLGRSAGEVVTVLEYMEDISYKCSKCGARHSAELKKVNDTYLYLTVACADYGNFPMINHFQ